MFDFDSVHFDEKVVIMLQKRNSIRRVLESFMRTFPVHGSSAYSRASGPKPLLWPLRCTTSSESEYGIFHPVPPAGRGALEAVLAHVILKPHGFSYFERLYNTLFGGAPYALYFRFFKQFSRAGRDV